MDYMHQSVAVPVMGHITPKIIGLHHCPMIESMIPVILATIFLNFILSNKTNKMKKIIFTTILLLLVSVTFSDRYITRGPNPGEIYFLGPTYTGEGLFYSTDYGMTAVCMDSTIFNAMRIAADKTPGVIYYATMTGAFYSSNNYGNSGTWQYSNGGIYLLINSGVNEGFIYNAINSHSEDYGVNFIPHSYNGFLGSLKATEIDNQNNIGYAIVNKYGVNDSLFILITNDNFENLTIQNELFMWATNVVQLSRGINTGELFLFNRNEYKLYYTNDYCLSWITVNTFNQTYEFDDIVGGRNEGEIYVLFRNIFMMWQDANIYILHSTDYGITFEVFHPFSKGQEPLLANFSAKTENSSIYQLITDNNDSVYYPAGEMPLIVQFYNYSIGDINSYEWDFDNDGIVDSYEKNPEYTYADTGWFSVNLSVYDDIDTNSFLREGYIHAYKITGTCDKFLNETIDFRCYPNPFIDKITLKYYASWSTKIELSLFDVSGKEMNLKRTIQATEGEHSINLDFGFLNPGVYYISLNANGKSQSVKKLVVK